MGGRWFRLCRFNYNNYDDHNIQNYNYFQSAREAPPAEGRPAEGALGGGAPPAPSSRIITIFKALEMPRRPKAVQQGASGGGRSPPGTISQNYNYIIRTAFYNLKNLDNIHDIIDIIIF